MRDFYDFRVCSEARILLAMQRMIRAGREMESGPFAAAEKPVSDDRPTFDTDIWPSIIEVSPVIFSNAEMGPVLPYHDLVATCGRLACIHIP